MPDTTLSKELRAQWLLEIREKHVKKFVFNTDELTSLVTQTTELEAAFNNHVPAGNAVQETVRETMHITLEE